MDIISLGKAKKAIREMQSYHKEVLEEGVQAHFPSIDARIDYLERQFSMQELTRGFDFISSVKGTDKIEIVNNTIKLKHLGVDEDNKAVYAIEGKYETVFDIGPSVINIIESTLKMTKSTNHDVDIRVAESDDKIKFDPEITWINGYKPTKRFLKVVLTLTSRDSFDSKTTFDINLEEHENIVETDNGARLISNVEYKIPNDSSWAGNRSLFRQKINRNDWLRIDKLNIKD